MSNTPAAHSPVVENFVNQGPVRPKTPSAAKNVVTRLIDRKDDETVGEEIWPGQQSRLAMLRDARANYPMPSEVDHRNKYHRICDFIDWCAASKSWAYYYIPYTVIVSVIETKSDFIAKRGTGAVTLIATQLGGHKVHMRVKHGRELHLEGGHVRATVDLRDFAKNIEPKRERVKERLDEGMREMYKAHGLDTNEKIDDAVARGDITPNKAVDMKKILSGLLLTVGKK